MSYLILVLTVNRARTQMHDRGKKGWEIGPQDTVHNILPFYPFVAPYDSLSTWSCARFRISVDVMTQRHKVVESDRGVRAAID